MSSDGILTKTFWNLTNSKLFEFDQIGVAELEFDVKKQEI